MDNNGRKIGYSYDKNGNIETITYNKGEGSENEKTIHYTYNELNELIREDNQVLNKTVKYSYDVGGNILKKEEFEYTREVPQTLGKTYEYKYEDTNWKDKLTSFYDGEEIKQITYDAIGNPLTYDGYTYTWENGRQLKSITKGDLNISFKYNDSGIRTEKTVNGKTTKYHLLGDKVTFETDGENSIYYTYDSNDNLVSMNLNGLEYYYIRNAQGDITGLFDKTGTQVVSYTYDSWGQLISIDGSLKDTLGKINSYLYRGYRYDNETQLYYLQSRYYNPSWGRFINADAIGGVVGELLSHNAFIYCANNFINNIDPNGYSSISINNKINSSYFFKAVVMIATAGSMLINNVNSQIKTISNAISNVGISISNYQPKSKQKSKTNANTKTIAKTNNNQPKPSYWEAEFNNKTKLVEVGKAISQGDAIKRAASSQSIMCANYTKARQVAVIFPGAYQEINRGKYGTAEFYPHFHINEEHGEPHIWFYPGNN